MKRIAAAFSIAVIFVIATMSTSYGYGDNTPVTTNTPSDNVSTYLPDTGADDDTSLLISTGVLLIVGGGLVYVISRKRRGRSR